MNITENSPSEDQQREALRVIRESLINTAFQHYNTLINYLKSLPIPQQIPELQKAYSYLADGIVWTKEVLTYGPIILPTPKKEEITVGEENPSVELSSVAE